MREDKSPVTYEMVFLDPAWIFYTAIRILNHLIGMQCYKTYRCIFFGCVAHVAVKTRPVVIFIHIHRGFMGCHKSWGLEEMFVQRMLPSTWRLQYIHIYIYLCICQIITISLWIANKTFNSYDLVTRGKQICLSSTVQVSLASCPDLWQNSTKSRENYKPLLLVSDIFPGYGKGVHSILGQQFEKKRMFLPSDSVFV